MLWYGHWLFSSGGGRLCWLFLPLRCLLRLYLLLDHWLHWLHWLLYSGTIALRWDLTFWLGSLSHTLLDNLLTIRNFTTRKVIVAELLSRHLPELGLY